MDIYKIKFTVLQLEIFRLFCIKTGARLNQRQVAKLLHVTPTAIAKALPLLEKEKIIKVTRGSTKVNFVELARDVHKTLELKKAENFKILIESELPSYLEESFPSCTIILFGSYAKGDDVSTSDIDIAVIGGKEKDVNLNQFEKKLEKEIRINYYSSLKEINPHLRSNILNGIILSGGIEL